MWRILVADEIRLAASDTSLAEIDYRPGISRAELLEVLGNYDALITRSRTKVDAAVLQAGNRLRVIGRGGVGVDNIDLEAATSRGVLVVNVPEANTESAAELAFGLMIAAARGIARSDREMRTGVWDRSFLGQELGGKRLGIVGLGRIGGQISRFARAMEMEVYAYDPYIPRSRSESLGVTLLDELGELLPLVDFLTVHTPLTDETRGMIGARELALLPAGAIVVNAARGGIIEEAALLEALDSGHIFALGIDVFVEEPPSPEHPLIRHPRVVHTAHLGANTFAAQDRVGEAILDRVLKTLSGNLSFAINTGFDPRSLELLGPWFPLAERLGKLAGQIARGRVEELEVRFFGEFEADTEALASATAKGLATIALSQAQVNLVSSRPLLKERGVKVSIYQQEEPLSYPQVVSARIKTDWETREVMGTILAGSPRLVGIDGYRLELFPEGNLLICLNLDKPGVVGKVGSLLGQAEINIAEMRLGREAPGGKALFVLVLDQRPSPEVIEAILELGVIERIDAVEL